MSDVLVLDTGPLVAYFDRDEDHHRWARDAFAAWHARVVSCEAVIAESWYLLRRHKDAQDALLGLVADRTLEVDYSLRADAVNVRRLVKRYRSVPMSLADACILSLAERHRAPVCTLDSDFRIYRTERKTALALIMPE